MRSAIAAACRARQGAGKAVPFGARMPGRRRVARIFSHGALRYDERMKRDIALRELNQRADALKAMGATSLYLFGSTVRDEAADGSDIDLFIDYDRESRFSLLDLVGIKLYLEDELLIPIDVTTRDSLHPLLSERIQQDAVRVF